MRHQQLKIIGLLVAIALIPTTAIASEIKVKTGSVEASTNRNGSIYVNTRKTRVRVPSRPASYWNYFRYWRLPWQSGNCRHSTYQKTTHVSQSGSRVVQNNVSSRTCY